MASLRTRLIAIPTLILLVGLAATVAFNIHWAQLRVQAETSSGMRLARLLVDAALLKLRAAPDPGTALRQLAAELPAVRHVDLAVLPAPDMMLLGYTPYMRQDRVAVPLWFARLFEPPPQAETVPLIVQGREYGQIAILSNPLDEVGENWGDLQFLAALLLALSLAIVALLVWTATLALRPIRELADGFDRLEHGRFDELMAPLGVAELRRIGEQFNSLARSLKRVTADNHMLIDRLISVQEAERKEVARELHDEFGPSLFAIRADVSCIMRLVRDGGAASPDVAERARSIGELVDGIQRINYRMLDRLRPLVLDQMGLAEALRQLVTSSQERYPDIAWSLHMPERIPLPGETASLTLYRVVQESLTNAVRHASAARIAVQLEQLAAAHDAVPPGSTLHVSVRDDGRGLPPDLRFGFGLLGMSERVRALGGWLTVADAPARGAVVDVFLPL